MFLRTPRLLATTTPTTYTATTPLSTLPTTLLPPIPLYRRVLRAHRHKLKDPEMRVLGDKYVIAEFHTHQKVENPLHIIGFLTEWQKYAQTLEGDGWKGERVDVGLLERLSEEQVRQLWELMGAIKESGGKKGE